MKMDLINSENIYQALFEATSDPMLLLKDGRFIECNQSALTLLAYSFKADLLNLRPIDISPPLQADGRCSQEKAKEMMANALSNGRQCFKWLHQRVDGLIIPLEVILTPIHLAGEVFLHVVWRDISEREQIKLQLESSETKLRFLYDASPDAMTTIKNHEFVDCNKAALLLFGCSDNSALLGLHPAELSPILQACGKTSVELSDLYIDTALKKGSAYFEWIHKRIDTGESFPTEVQLFAVKIDGVYCVQAFIRDISLRILNELALQESEFRWKFALEGAGDGVWDWDIQSNEASYSKLWKQMLGYSENDILPTNDEWTARIHPDDALYVATTLQAYLAGHTEVYIVEYRLRCKDNSYKWMLGRGMVVSHDADEKPLRMIGTHTDITYRKNMEEELRQLAFYDGLTKVANRLLLNDRLKLAIANNKRSSHYLAVLFMDLDNFKPLNDQHGHLVGDLLLIEVARRLKTCVRKGDTVSRFGGDEFVVMLSDLAESKTYAQNQVSLVANKILILLAEPYELIVHQEDGSENKVKHQCTASIGVALINQIGSFDDILRWADAAMYNAKSSGRNRICFHETLSSAG